MNTKNKIIAILMASIVAMAVGVPMAFGEVASKATVGDVAPTYSCTATTTGPEPGVDGAVEFELVVTDGNGADDILNAGWTAEWGARLSVPLTKIAETATTKTFNGSDIIPKCKAAGNYIASFKNSTAEVCNNTFTVNSTTGFNLNFSAVNYGNVTVNEKKVVTPGTLHNIGNAGNITIKINATKMTPGNVYLPDNVNNKDMNLDAKVPGTTGVEKSLPASVWVPFDHPFVCCAAESLDFSITAPIVLPGPYTGQIEIGVQP